MFGSADVFSVLSSLDVLVVPSLWRENSPLIVLQALASGLPLLVSDVDGMPKQVISGVNASLFPPGDSRALATQLCYWLKTPGDLGVGESRWSTAHNCGLWRSAETIYARFHRVKACLRSLLVPVALSGLILSMVFAAGYRVGLRAISPA